MKRDKLAVALGIKAPGTRVEFEAPLAAMTSLRIGGPAEMLVSPSTVEDARECVLELNSHGISPLILGGGTNMLISDKGIRGAVLILAAMDSLEAKDDGDRVLIKAGAGLPMSRLMGYIRKEGLSGLEGLVGIPGFVGGAIAGNAGSFGSEMMDAVVDIEALDKDGEPVTIKASELKPSYRSSGLPEGTVILGAMLSLKRAEQREVAALMDENLKIKSATQPLGQRSAGCVFRNPGGDSAGRLIDTAGLKGMGFGAIEVSTVHAGFFINKGGGTSEDFMRLMDMVSMRVMKEFGVKLEPEIKVVGIDA